jgi:hypothetical protein
LDKGERFGADKCDCSPPEREATLRWCGEAPGGGKDVKFDLGTGIGSLEK